VSYCELEDEIHFNPPIETKLIIKYRKIVSIDNSDPGIVKGTKSDNNQSTRLYAYDNENVRGIDLFDKITIDGVEVSISDIDTNTGNYLLSEGEHIVKYTLKDNIDSFPYGLFMGCSSIINVTIPYGITSIGSGCFSGCTNFVNITIPNSVTTIGDSAFSGCLNLTNITIPNITTINAGTFEDCSSLTNVIIPDSVTTIGNFVFRRCTNLTNITIGSNVTIMGTYIFESCGNLSTITSLCTTAPEINS
jgi:hypothetical protein